jgi:hypothetical protein
MIARVLPPSEYALLDVVPTPPLAPHVRPEDLAIVVVESDGRVVASIAVLRAVHFESVWVSPEARNGGAVRSLLRKATTLAREWGAGFVFGGAENEAMRENLDRMGAVWLPFHPCVLPLAGGESCQRPS